METDYTADKANKAIRENNVVFAEYTALITNGNPIILPKNILSDLQSKVQANKRELEACLRLFTEQCNIDRTVPLISNLKRMEINLDGYIKTKDKQVTNHLGNVGIMESSNWLWEVVKILFYIGVIIALYNFFF
ncbi:hypothetical protein [Labilibaculum euxinus]|uniref:Uncharacterized protein n=1 Tax=Labilibaculum euxinus TaxID=2686357 RepID=A0A7M4D2E4_9BACT|nr:hypothetical protein [Labilibaculum euxinus]MUP36823.1 hypothetical protein [Labilibaculum euxinus]MVB06028.1 hypothetical protein [Labilibaculum euxinus]